MNRLFRIVLALLLAVSLPVQGLASASKASCHHGRSDRVEHGESEAHPHRPAIDDAHRDRHDDTHADDLSTTSHGSCSACASCSVGAAMPFAETAVPAVPIDRRYAFAPPISFASFLTSGQERPPRSIPA